MGLGAGTGPDVAVQLHRLCGLECEAAGLNSVCSNVVYQHSCQNNLKMLNVIERAFS